MMTVCSCKGGFARHVGTLRIAEPLSAAEFIRKRYGWEYGVPAYALAGYVGYTRVESREHYAHDVVAGAAIGFLGTFFFTRTYHGFQAAPLTGPHDAQGVKFIHVW